MAKSKLDDGADAIARDLNGPTGPIKLARVVRRHLAWFEQAQHRGLTWEQIAALLASKGAHGPDGRRFTVGHLSSTVWREKAKAVAQLTEPTNVTSAAPRMQRSTRRQATSVDGLRPSVGGADGVLSYLSRMSSRKRARDSE